MDSRTDSDTNRDDDSTDRKAKESKSWSPPPFLWLIISCLIAGMVGEAGSYKTLWGSGDRFYEFGFPFWMSYGSTHIPGLLVGYSILRILRSSDRNSLITARCFFLGLFIAGFIADFDLKQMNLHQSPLWLFLMVDGITLFLFSLIYIKPAKKLTSVRVRKLLIVFLLPALIVISIRIGYAVFDEKPVYQIWTSDYWEQQDLELFWVVLKNPEKTAKAECQRLARFAPDPYLYMQNRDYNWPERHRIILVYKDDRSIGMQNPSQALYQFEWWPKGRSECRRLGVDYEEIPGLRGNIPDAYPLP